LTRTSAQRSRAGRRSSKPRALLRNSQQVGFQVVAVQPGALAQRVAVGELDIALLLLRTVRQVVLHFSSTAHFLDLAGARAADRRITLQSIFYRIRFRLPQAIGEHDGVFAAAGTPQAIVQKLNAEFIHAMNVPEVKKQIESSGY
jgi:hypothetical protein